MRLTKSQTRLETPEPIVVPDNDDVSQVDEQLTNYIRAHMVTAAPAAGQPVQRSMISVLIMPLAYLAGALLFSFAIVFSMVAGWLERRTNTKIWDAAGLPIVASDAADGEYRERL